MSNISENLILNGPCLVILAINRGDEIKVPRHELSALKVIARLAGTNTYSVRKIILLINDLMV